MKRTLTTLLLTLGIASTAAFADVAVYSGKVGAKTIAGDNSGNGVVSVYVVVDLTANKSRSIEYFKFGPFKRYYVSPQTLDLTKTQAEDKKGKTSTAFSYSNASTFGNFDYLDTGFLTGNDAKKPLVIKTGSEAIALPTTLKGTVYRTKTAITGTSIEGNEISTAGSVLQLDVKRSLAANDAKDEGGNADPLTLDETIASLEAELIAKKYENQND